MSLTNEDISISFQDSKLYSFGISISYEFVDLKVVLFFNSLKDDLDLGKRQGSLDHPWPDYDYYYNYEENFEEVCFVMKIK